MPDYRTQFADFGETTYLNCAYQGVFPLTAVARAHEAIELKCHPERMRPAEFFELPKRVRSHLARIIGSNENEIALISGATQGIGIVAAGLQLQPGDEVIVAASNFPSNLFTWLHLRRLGVRVHVLRDDPGPFQVEDVARAFTPRTRLLALDWVEFSTGRRIDLAALGELAHQRGALFVVDGTQGAGALELNIHELPVDVFVAAAYKWLLGPYGTGFVYLRDELLNRLDLKVVNWLSVDGSDNFDALPVDDFVLPRAAGIFDSAATANFLNLYAFEACLEFVLGVGVASVTRHCTDLLNFAADRLRSKGYHLGNHDDRSRLASPILTFQGQSDDATAKLYGDLKAKHIEVSLRHNRIRVSPYLYNNSEDIERLLDMAN